MAKRNIVFSPIGATRVGVNIVTGNKVEALRELTMSEMAEITMRFVAGSCVETNSDNISLEDENGESLFEIKVNEEFLSRFNIIKTVKNG